jgi:uncharacterized protein (DUF1800 family)
MKRKTAILALMMIFTFAACGVQPAESTNVRADPSQVSTQAISNDPTLATLPADSESDSSATTTTVETITVETTTAETTAAETTAAETTAGTPKQESPI